MTHKPYHSSVLEGILEVYSLIDQDDPYQVYCLFRLIDCECVKCGRELSLLEIAGISGTPSWVKNAASFVRNQGWFVPSRNGDWHFIEAYCPKCGLTRTFEALGVETLVSATP